MRHYILASHAYFAKGIESALELIIGEQENLSYYSAYVEDDDEHFKDKLIREIDSYDKDDEIIIMTDLFGGSVNNELLDLISSKGVHLVTGVNLILVMSMLLASQDEPIGETIKRLIEEAKEGMIYCNELSIDNESSIDEF